MTRLRDDYGYDVSAIVSGADGPLVDRLRAAGISVHAADFDFPSLPSVLETIRLSLALARLLRRERFDIVQTALWHSMLLGRFAAWLADVPVRLTMHAGPYYIDGPIHRWIDGSTTWMETFLIGCCRSIVESYRQLGVRDNRLELVYYGPDETRFDPATTVPSDIREEYGWTAETPLIAHVAWFYPRIPVSRWAPAITRGKDLKGREDLIRAAPYILREFPNAKILLVGTAFVPPAELVVEEVRALVADLALEDSVILTGFRPSVNDVLLAADVAVQPSLTEGCGGTFESLLLERPTVGTRIGGIPDMVIDGETGVLVTPADPTDLARGICELLRDPARAQALGKAGRQHVLRTASLTRTVADLDRLYRQWLFPGERRRPGYRWWALWVRLPVLIAVAVYLNIRLHVIEYRLIPRWQAGWRPWHMLPRIRWQAVRHLLASVILRRQAPQLAFRDVVAMPSLSSVPICALAMAWGRKLWRGEARPDKATMRLIVLDLIAIQPASIRTFIYESIASYRRRTRGDARDLKHGSGV